MIEKLYPLSDLPPAVVLANRQDPSYRLRQNDPEQTRLDLTAALLHSYDAARIADLVDAMQYNTTVKTVHLSGHNMEEFFPTQDDLRKLLTTICSMSAIEEFFVFRGGSELLTEKLLAECLPIAEQLKVLMFWGFDEMQPVLVASLTHLRYLKRLTITLPNNLPWACLDVLTMGLAGHPNLECLSVRCEGRQLESAISPDAFRLLLGSVTIDNLYLENLGLTDEHIDIATEELPNNNTLTLLDVQDNLLSDDTLYSLAQLVPRNDTLRTLNVSGCGISEDGGWKLAKAMQQNSTLHNVELEGTLERCTCHVEKHILSHSSGVLVSFLTTLTVSDEFDIPVGHTQTDWAIALDFQIRLNRAGTGQNNRKRFVESLVSVSDHLDCIYHFCKLYPTHFDRELHLPVRDPFHKWG